MAELAKQWWHDARVPQVPVSIVIIGAFACVCVCMPIPVPVGTSQAQIQQRCATLICAIVSFANGLHPWNWHVTEFQNYKP